MSQKRLITPLRQQWRRENQTFLTINAAGPNPLLDQASGNVNPDRGRSRARERATDVAFAEENKAVESAKKRILSGDPANHVARARQTLVDAIHDNDVALQEQRLKHSKV